MTAIASHAEVAEREAPPGWWWSVSGRLIRLMLFFVVLAQVLIYIPAVAQFRASWIGDRVMGAQMVALALSSTTPGALSPELEERLLSGIKGAQAIGVRGQGTRWLLATASDMPPEAPREIDLRRTTWFRELRGALRTLVLPIPPATRIIGPGAPGTASVEWVEIVLDEAVLRHAMLSFTRDFLLLSLTLSAVTALLLYLALHKLVVKPVRHLTANIADFATDPTDPSRVILPSDRPDEFGRAEVALARLETALTTELRRKRALVDLGLAVSKINHEMRNMLTTAQLLGDRLALVDDPAVKRVAPRLVRTLARAIAYCEATLAYGRTTEAAPERRLCALRPIVAEQLDLVDRSRIAVALDVAPDLLVDADPDQLGRGILNIVRNAAQALAGRPEANLRLEGRRTGGAVTLRIADNGPGVPAAKRAELFTAFRSAGRAGGTGLGLPVAFEIMALHGGTIALEETAHGASFLMTIPDRT